MKPHPLFLIAVTICLACNAAMAAAAASSGIKFKGTVVDSDGKPVNGATVESHVSFGGVRQLEEVELKQTTLTTNGAFEVLLDPSYATVLVRKEGYASAWRSAFNSTGDVEGQLTLGRPTTISGKVVDEADKPIADAKVFVVLATMMSDLGQGSRSVGYLMSGPARRLFHARTAADGSFSIQGFPAGGSVELTAEAAGKALRRQPRQSMSLEQLTAQAGDNDVRLVMEPAGVVEGKVVIEGTDQAPLMGRITLQADGPTFFGIGRVGPVPLDPDGSFKVTGLSAGQYRVQAKLGTNALPDWVAEPVTVDVETGKTNTGVELKASRGGVLDVTILNKKGRDLLKDVSVTAMRQEYSQVSNSDEKGKVVFRLPKGEYQLLAMLGEPRSQTLSATVEEGQTNRIEFELSGPPKVKGIVRLANGDPAAGVEVRIVGSYSAPRSPDKTDSHGRFEVTASPSLGEDRVQCLLVRDTVRNLAYAGDLDEDAETVEVQLAPAITLAGRVECDGKPVTNPSVGLIFWTGNSGMHLYGLATGTNIAGTFELAALPPGRKYGLVVSATGYGQKSVYTVPSDGEGKLEVDSVELKRANLKLAGQVVDADEKPVAGVRVHMMGDGQPSGNITTDRQGNFVFESVCDGPVRLMASGRSMQGNVTANGGDTNVVLKLGESSAMMASSGSTTFKVKGTVTDPDGKPVQAAVVMAFPSSRSVKTAADGTYTLSWSLQSWQMQQGGDPLLIVRDSARNLAVAESVPDGTTNLNLQLKPGLTVAGKVEGQNGTALANARIDLQLLAGRSYNQVQSQPISTDAQGQFEIKALPIGPRYMIFASAKDYGRSRLDFGEDVETNRLELAPFALKLADQILEGQVLNERDKPASGVQVTVAGDDQPATSVTTDKEGRFRLKVCEGTVQLFAHGDSGYANLQAAAGDTNVVIQIRSSGGMARSVPKRSSLKGKPLPDLAELGFAAEAKPSGKPTLLVLLDAEQRNCRRSARLLCDQHEALRQKGLTILAVQTVSVSADTIQSWTNSAPLTFPLACVKEKSPKVRWATEVESLPWLILCDREGKVADEGFAVDDLAAKLDALKW